jgi:nicotinate-nucleotide pyrophosphorylase (carboxylating)
MGEMGDPRKTLAMRLLEEKFGQPIEFLLAQGTLNEVAEALGITFTTVSKWRLRLGLRERTSGRSDVTRSQHDAARETFFQRLRRSGASTNELLQAADSFSEVDKQFREPNRRLAEMLRQAHLRRLALSALIEDRADEDVTTTALIPEDQTGRGVIIAKAEGVLAGLPVARTVFLAVDTTLVWKPSLEDGLRLSPRNRIATIEGSLASILRAERVALNYLTHLSGVASATDAVVRVLEGTGCRLRDTRKTIPGLRALEKYAVRLGGGSSHRLNLAEGVLIKDNHLAALLDRDLGVPEAVSLARTGLAGMRVEIEVTTVDEARQALDAAADELLLDNMPLDQMREVVALAAARDPRPALEASGGITLHNARQVAETGVDYISMGAITHSAPALDMSLELEKAASSQP